MFFCPVCDEHFKNVSSLIRHIKIKHAFVTRFTCKQLGCKRRFQNIYNLKRHYQLKHKVEENVNLFSESNCDKISENQLQPCSVDLEQTIVTEVNGYVDFKESLLQEVPLFIAKLYSNYSFPRNIVQSMILDLTKLLGQPIELLKVKLKSSIHNNEKDKNEIIDMLNSLGNLFQNFGSEYLRFQHFQSLSTFIAPIPIIIGQTLGDKRIHSRITLQLTDNSCQYIPIHKTLQAFLQLPLVFDSICSYISNLKDSQTITNLIQGTLWNDILKRFGEKIVFPIYLYGDDFEIGNPLGSHAGVHKVFGVYFSLGCLPPEFSSLLENIFLLQLGYSSDVKTFGNEKVFQTIISDLILLENDGLTIVTKKDTHHVYFVAVLILGDNLGINSMLGLTESFSSNYYCRFCRCNKDEASYSLYENVSLLRTAENYEHDVFSNSCGIKEKCVFHKLPNFHITRNLSCDIMHDLWEGICRYDLGNLLFHFICVDKFFTLETLNNRMQFYNFLNENKPSSITKSQLLKKYIMFSASEMSIFVKNFSLIIGDLVPVGNPLWEMFIVLKEIIDIINSRIVMKEYFELLKVLIAEHHALYIEFFGKLKPKHHLLTHYPRLLCSVGPLKNVSSVRFEGKHKQFKSTANVVSSRKNILYTLALKNQLNMCYRVMAKKGFENKIEVGSEDLDFIDSVEYAKFASAFNYNMPNDYFATTSIQVLGVKYTFDLVLIIDNSDIQPYFGIIRSIIVNQNTDEVYFILTKLMTTAFNEHLLAYEVEHTEDLLFVKWNEIQNNIPTLIRIVNHKLFVIVY